MQRQDQEWIATITREGMGWGVDAGVSGGSKGEDSAVRKGRREGCREIKREKKKDGLRYKHNDVDPPVSQSPPALLTQGNNSISSSTTINPPQPASSGGGACFCSWFARFSLPYNLASALRDSTCFPRRESRVFTQKPLSRPCLNLPAASTRDISVLHLLQCSRYRKAAAVVFCAALTASWAQTAGVRCRNA